VFYQNGSGWLTLDNAGGQNNGSVRVYAQSLNLTSGIYKATVVIDAGPMAGSITIPVTLTAIAPQLPPPTPTPAPTPTVPQVTVTSVVNAATFSPTALVPGSLGTVLGTNLSGKNVGVTFDGKPATLLYVSATQINLQVPPDLGAKTSASMVVTVDGTSSAPTAVALSPAWPGIFNPGVLNQDNTVNSAANPAHAGGIVQVFATGIPGTVTVSGSIGGQSNLVPLYAGPAPGITGVQQVNLKVPSGVSGSTAPLIVCAAVAGGAQPYCSAAATLFVAP
jgi:uncharacterized protein (TIGR03437 family)